MTNDLSDLLATIKKENETGVTTRPSTTVVPTLPANSPRLAIIGDFPRSSSSTSPFDGPHFTNIKFQLKDAGYDINQCFLGNVLTYHPGKFTTSRFDFSEGQALASVSSLLEELKAFKPDFIICLGPLSLRFFKGVSKGFDDERGSPFIENHLGTLTLATYHPRDTFIQYKLTAIQAADFAKAVRLLRSGFTFDSVRPLRIKFFPTYEECLSLLKQFYDKRTYLVCDIETNYRSLITCIGFAYTPYAAICVPLYLKGGVPIHSAYQEGTLWRFMKPLLEKNQICGQNFAHFDHFQLALNYGINCNVVDDTMFAQWEVYQEFPKSLGFINSLYSDNPFWKGDLKKARSGKVDPKVEFEYNAKDCCYTYQGLHALRKELHEKGKGSELHYKFNIALARPYQYASIRGVPYDLKKAKERIDELQVEHDNVLGELRKECLMMDFNPNSPKQKKELLYEKLKLPVKTKLSRNSMGEKEERETADYLSLLYLSHEYPHITELSYLVKLSKIGKRLSMLKGIVPDKNGYVRWNFNVVGTETGRSSGYKSYDGHGPQPQNVSREDRDLFLGSFDGSLLWSKADLEGADSWTQAAQLAHLGHHVLMNDLRAGLKPAQALAIASLVNWDLLSASADEISQHKHVLKTPEGKVRYRVMKAVSHGSAYMMKKNMMHANIFKQSMGELYIRPFECEQYQKAFYQRYPFPELHEFMRRKMMKGDPLGCCTGNVRHFFGRRDDATLRQMLAHIPQQLTAYTVGVLMLRLFYDRGNRVPSSPSKLIIEPVNQVHDEVDLIFPADQVEHFRETFVKHRDVTLDVWGQEFKIPFEATYGKSWGEQDEDTAV